MVKVKLVQFEDGNKKYDIKFKSVRNAKINPVLVFEMDITKPVVASDSFSIDDFRTFKGRTGIYFSQFSDVAKAAKSKKSVIIKVIPEAVDFIKKTHTEELEKLKIKAMKDPERWFWAFGGDTHELHITPDNEFGTNFRKDFEKLEKTLKNKINWKTNQLEAVSIPVERDSGLYTMNGWFEISHAEVMRVYNEFVSKTEAKKAEKQDKEAEIFAKAKETGEPQKLESFSVECNNPDESCDIDTIIIYAMPDGTKKEERIHSY
jgi:hypothetical protein